MVLDFAKEAVDKVNTHSINFDELRAGKANIKVIGVGGMGCNGVTWLFNKGINGATIFATNTDALHLSVTKADEKVLIGKGGLYGNVVRISPPLTVSKSEVDDFLKAMDKALENC